MAIQNVILGAIIVIGTVVLFYSLPSYASALKAGEKFDRKKFYRTLLLGAVVGGFLAAQGMGVTPDTVAAGEAWVETSFGGFIVVFLDKVLAYIFHEEHT